MPSSFDPVEPEPYDHRKDNIDLNLDFEVPVYLSKYEAQAAQISRDIATIKVIQEGVLLYSEGVVEQAKESGVDQFITFAEISKTPIDHFANCVLQESIDTLIKYRNEILEKINND